MRERLGFAWLVFELCAYRASARKPSESFRTWPLLGSTAYAVCLSLSLSTPVRITRPAADASTVMPRPISGRLSCCSGVLTSAVMDASASEMPTSTVSLSFVALAASTYMVAVSCATAHCPATGKNLCDRPTLPTVVLIPWASM